MVNTGLNFLSEGLKLNMGQRGLLIRAGWVILVSGHIAWVCGFLTFIGLQSPFVQAGVIEAVVEGQRGDKDSKIAELEDQVNLEAYRKASNISAWTSLDELKLSQLTRRLTQERLQKQKLEQAILEAKKK